MPSHAVTFDLWHTLLDLAPIAESEYMHRQWALGGECVGRAPEGPLAAELSAPLEPWTAFRRAYEEAVVAARHGSTISPEGQLLRAGALAGRRPSAEEYLRRLERLVGETPFRSVRGAKGVLEALRMYGCRLGVISNTIGEPGHLFSKVLQTHGLLRSFDTLVWSDEHPWAKPAPELFGYALRQLGTEAGNAIHVGDGSSDVLGAQAAGYRATILFEGSTEYAPEYRALFAPAAAAGLRPSYRVRRLEEIPDLVHRELGLRGNPR
ncbi:MAG TPA: HAD family hydrolase [Thermoplasmata archaeon]|jgi:HAD superfamily hydrolase (TIGR01549 family)|nr:HAD family hydrolase [Thermoplasmata archaeon]